MKLISSFVIEAARVAAGGSMVLAALPRNPQPLRPFLENLMVMARLHPLQTPSTRVPDKPAPESDQNGHTQQH